MDWMDLDLDSISDIELWKYVYLYAICCLRAFSYAIGRFQHCIKYSYIPFTYSFGNRPSEVGYIF